MNLQQQRIQALCEELKLPAVRTEWPTLAQRAAEAQASFADFLTSLLQSEQAARRERARQAWPTRTWEVAFTSVICSQSGSIFNRS